MRELQRETTRATPTKVKLIEAILTKARPIKVQPIIKAIPTEAIPIRLTLVQDM